MKTNNFKKGQKVYVASNDSRVKGFPAIVVSVGRKYITVSTNLNNSEGGRNYKFDSDTFYCVEWHVYELCESEEEYRHKEEIEEKVKYIIRTISNKRVFDDLFSEEEIDKLYNRLFEKYGK